MGELAYALGMKGFTENIEKLVLENENFRKVLYTARFSQLVLMSLKPGEEIGEETHEGDQFFRFEKGQGGVVIDNVNHEVCDGWAVVVLAGACHNVVNASTSEELKFYTIYSPPHHQKDVARATKVEALARETEFDGVTSE